MEEKKNIFIIKRDARRIVERKKNAPWTLMGNSAMSTLASRSNISKSASAHNKFGSSPMAYKHPSSVSSGKID
jgi:hypothetical protein